MDNYDGPNSLNNTGLGGAIPRESETVRVLTKLHQVIETANKQFCDLDNKLTPILRGPNPEVNKDTATPGYSSPLAQDINNACEKIENLIKYISSVRNRVEL